ncbi:hypothetical protein ACWA1C_11205 [Flectobacillus roseus]
MSHKAQTIYEIDQAVKFNEPIGPSHPFFTDFSGLRGEFEDRIVYKNLNVKKVDGTFTFNPALNGSNKSILFLGGMRGSGKTSELAKYAEKLNSPQCFLCVTCNIDQELDLNELEYMDILILQLEQLTKLLSNYGLTIDEGIKERLETWFAKRETEIKRDLKVEAELETGIEISTKNPLFSLLNIFGKFKTGVVGSNERANVVRQNLKNNFNSFATIFNEFIEEVNVSLRHNGIAQEILFIVDGLEKTLSANTRKKIIIEEQNRIDKIRAYTIFTLPIELMSQRPNLNQFSSVEAFPFVKLIERDGTEDETAFEKFKEFVYKRINSSLFENEAIVHKAIKYSGGSPRELLKILETTAFYVDEEQQQINEVALDKALHRLANQTAQYITEPMLEKMKKIIENNRHGKDTPFDEVLQTMLENIYVMEYNSGSYKRINPILELSNLYQQYVQG